MQQGQQHHGGKSLFGFGSSFDSISVSLNQLEIDCGKQTKKLLKMVIEIVDLPMKHGDFP